MSDDVEAIREVLVNGNLAHGPVEAARAALDRIEQREALAPEMAALLDKADGLVDCDSREHFDGKACAEAGYEDELCDGCEWNLALAALNQKAAQ